MANSTNYSICNGCRNRVPVTHVVRDGKVYLQKNCPDCGPTEALVSSNAEKWQFKRDLCRFDEDMPLTCSLNCKQCRFQHHPKMVFVDVTNRCNMNCPICIANIPGMGFEFNPPIEYFENIFQALGAMDPKPLVQLFGGEPTVRQDLFEIIDLARSKGLTVRVVTNGIRLADEDYCRELCEHKVHVLLAFDGRDPEIYARLRGHPEAYEKKVQALENLKKFSKRRSTIMCCVARGINDHKIRDLIDYVHENRDYIKCLHFIPLTETWAEGEFETDAATTSEDVEQIIDAAFPEETAESVPAGLSKHLELPSQFFGDFRLKFGGVHPNCESLMYVVSDGERYRPLSYYLTRPLREVADELVERADRIRPRLEKLNPDKFFQRWRGRLLVVRTFFGLLNGALDKKKLFKGSPLWATVSAASGSLFGAKFKDRIRKRLNVTDAMLMVILPFEEYHSVESARLQECFAGFAFEDPDTGRVRTLPVCIWTLYKNEIQRAIADKYAEGVASTESTTAAKAAG